MTEIPGSTESTELHLEGPRTSELPSGVITYLFTDVEGSTQLWQQHPDDMRAALAGHDALLASEIERHDGVPVRSRGEGDSFFAVFTHAPDAVAAACAIQRVLLRESWPADISIRVRMALHTGDAELRDHDYYGTTVNRCARLRAIAHGGQVVLSQATAGLVRDALPEGVGLRDLGSHRLKDLPGLEQVFQALHPDLPSDFPALKSPDKPRHNLPAQLTSFIGRETEIAEIKSLLSSGPLVSLTGSGGSGKSRLASEIASSELEVYPDGVWFASLAPLSDPKLVPQEVAAALDVSEDAVYDFLRDKSTLLVLDNCEHVVDECARFAGTLLAQAKGVKILATSQEAFGIAGEVIYRVPSLPVPDSPNASVEVLAGFEAVRLFTDRAAAVRPGFALTDQNAAAVGDIAQRLDGVPLAIELAAARVNMLSAEQIAARLDDCFRLLTQGRRTAVPRHQTLRSTLEWSYQLLLDPEHLLFDRLSVFRGGFTLEAVEQVCAGDGLDSYEVMDLLSQLVDKSLVVVEHGPEGEARYRLLEVLRLYGAERLAETGEAEDVRRRHASFFLRLAQEAEPKLHGPDQVSWLEKLDADYDNIRAVLGWSLEAGETETALRMCMALPWFWHVHRHVGGGEGIDWLEKALSLEGDAPPDARAGALLAAGFLAFTDLDDLDRANALMQESIQLWQQLDADEGVAEAYFLMGLCRSWLGDVEGSKMPFDKAEPMFQRLENVWGTAWCHMSRGLISALQGAYSEGERLMALGVEDFREIGDIQGVAWCLLLMGNLARIRGAYEQAQSLYTEGLAHWRLIGERAPTAALLVGLGTVNWLQGDRTGAMELCDEGLTHLKENGSRGTGIFIVPAMAHTARSRASVDRELERHRERIELPAELWSKATLAMCLHGMGKQAREQGRTEDASALLADSIALAREADDHGGIARALLEMAHIASGLRDFERVARLVGIVEEASEVTGDFLLPDERTAHQQLVNESEARLGDEAFDRIRKDGKAMALEDAVGYALEP